MESNPNQVIVRFEVDSENSISFETAKTLMAIIGAPSLEALIHQSLAAFRKSLEFTYCPDDGLPTCEQLAAIARIVPQDIQLKTISSLFGEHRVSLAEPNKEYTLKELMSGITEANTHERTSFGSLIGRELL